MRLLEYECDMGRPSGLALRLPSSPALPRWAKLVRRLRDLISATLADHPGTAVGFETTLACPKIAVVIVTEELVSSCVNPYPPSICYHFRHC
jgi:hypothetical protein